MDRAEAHDLLWTKYLDASSRLHDLERYLEHTQSYLHREQTYFRDEAHPDLEIEFLPLYRDTFPPILHASVIVSVAMLLEQEVRELAAAFIAAVDLKVKFNDLAGSVLDRFRTLATKVAGLIIEDYRFQWADLVGLFELRNCIVHSQGMLSDFQRSAVVSTFASKHEPSLLIDGQAVPTDKTSEVAVRIASRFLLVAYASALQHCPGPNTGYVMRELQREER
jgi:hypothetical protein